MFLNVMKALEWFLNVFVVLVAILLFVALCLGSFYNVCKYE